MIDGYNHRFLSLPRARLVSKGPKKKIFFVKSVSFRILILTSGERIQEIEPANLVGGLLLRCDRTGRTALSWADLGHLLLPVKRDIRRHHRGERIISDVKSVGLGL